MFHGGFPHEKDITVPDVDPVAFKILLKYNVILILNYPLLSSIVFFFKVYLYR